MILIIKGHIHNTFENNNLLNLIKSINEINENLKIYIHTWNIFTSNINWRYLEQNKLFMSILEN